MSAATRMLALHILLSSFTASAHPKANPPAPPTLCPTPERTVFTCQLETKIVSICATPGNTGATYRYGIQGHVELSLTNLKRAYRGWSGGGETQAYAATPTARYLVYDQTIRTGVDPEGHNLPQVTQGLLVLSSQRTLSSKLCTPPSGQEGQALSLMKLEKLIPEGPFIEH